MQADVWHPAYIALGSNLNSPLVQIRSALDSLRQLPNCTSLQCSACYQSAPMGPKDQPDFINAVCGLMTRVSALELLAALQGIEQQMGRVHVSHWGPRNIDLDLLLFGNASCADSQLTLPHPGLLTRDFVLVPLAEIAPDLMLPNNRSVRSVAAGFAAQPGLTRVAHAA